MANKHVDEGVECVDGEDLNFKSGITDLETAIELLRSLVIDNSRSELIKKDAMLYIASGIGLVKIYR